MIVAESGSALSERALVKHAQSATKIRHLENRGFIGCPADYADAANLKLKKLQQIKLLHIKFKKTKSNIEFLLVAIIRRIAGHDEPLRQLLKLV